MAGFDQLETWKECRVFRNEISNLTVSFPREVKYRLVDQIIRSSRSVTANIAEGHGKYHYQENIQCCRMARGSLNETLDHLICAQDCKYISTDQLQSFKVRFDACQKLINGYIAYLKRKKSEG